MGFWRRDKRPYAEDQVLEQTENTGDGQQGHGDTDLAQGTEAFWKKAERVLKRISEAMRGDDIADDDNSASNVQFTGDDSNAQRIDAERQMDAGKRPAHKSTAPHGTAHGVAEKPVAPAQKRTGNNSTAQAGSSLPAVQTIADSYGTPSAANRDCKKTEVAADALSEELQVRINKKFSGLQAITSGLAGDGFWVQHRPADWVYGVDYV